MKLKDINLHTLGVHMSSGGMEGNTEGKNTEDKYSSKPATNGTVKK